MSDDFASQYLKSGMAEQPFSVCGMPWHFRYPQQTLIEWQFKIKSVVAHYLSQSQRAQNELRQVDILRSTKQRLQVLDEAYKKSADEFSQILKYLENPESHNSPLKKNTSVDPAIFAPFFEKVPRQQTVMAYHDIFFRDWVWGNEEIQKQADYLMPHLAQSKKILVCGAGACGLPLEIHKRLQPDLMLATDINPVLFIQTKRILNGEKLNPIEYPAIARDAKYVRIEHEIQLSKSQLDNFKNFKMLFADAQNIETQPFDAVLTPWFVDIIPRPFHELARHINQNLNLGGKWINMGQLAFERNTLSEKLTSQEVQETLQDSGYEIEKLEWVELPYLSSPYSTMRRIDQILIFSAIKTKQAKKPSRFEYLPQWLRALDTPIPRVPEIDNLHTKTEIFARVLRHVDGKKDFHQIAEAFSKENGLDIASTKDALHMFFVNVYEQLIFREF